MRRRGRRKRTVPAATIVAAGAAADEAATAGHGARGMATASGEEGGLRAALSRNRRLGVETVVVLAVLAAGAFIVYHFFVKTIKNTRPLGGANVVVTRGHTAAESEASFAVDITRTSTIFGAANDLTSYTSQDDGRTWKIAPAPTLRGAGCPFHAPRATSVGTTELMAFLASEPCGDDITPYLVVTTRAGAAGRWRRAIRVAPPAWKYGFDDAPAVASDRNANIVYLAWTRGLTDKAAGTVVSRSSDGGRTWSKPVLVAPPRDEPHTPSVAVAENGDVYVGGIDATHGIWVATSTDHGRTFSAPAQLGRLRANPSATCALAGLQPLPKEETSCLGPAPTLLATSRGPVAVYDDVGVNRTQDVVAAGAGFEVTVTPPDRGKTQQFFPVAAVDPETGVLWACWYDTTFDSHAHRAWFTCAASRDGRRWSSPERAAADPTQVADIYTDLGAANGFWPSVVAAAGTAHPFWIQIGSVNLDQNIATARLPERGAFAVAP